MPAFNELVCGLVARGMTTRDVCGHVADVYGVEISPELVSRITDAIMPELRERRRAERARAPTRARSAAWRRAQPCGTRPGDATP